MPLLTLGPRVGPQQVVTQDVTSDPVPFFGFRLLVMARTCLLHACSLDIPVTCPAIDIVAVAPSSSL